MFYGLRMCKLKDGGNIDLNRTMHNWQGGYFIIISLLGFDLCILLSPLIEPNEYHRLGFPCASVRICLPMQEKREDLPLIREDSTQCRATEPFCPNWEPN